MSYVSESQDGPIMVEVEVKNLAPPEPLPPVKLGMLGVEKPGVKCDAKGFCDIFGRTFLQLFFI